MPMPAPKPRIDKPYKLKLVLVLGLTDKTKLGEWLRGALVSHGAGDDSHRRDTGIFFWIMEALLSLASYSLKSYLILNNRKHMTTSTSVTGHTKNRSTD